MTGIRTAFDRAERFVGSPLEAAVGSRAFADALVGGFRVQRAVLGFYERQAGSVLRALVLPSATDLRHLNREVAALTAEVREIAAQVEELRTASRS